MDKDGSLLIHGVRADDDVACERGANVSRSTRVHARVTSLRQIRPVCGAFAAAETRPCPRFPVWRRMVRRGVDGSSPSEGLEIAANRNNQLSVLKTTSHRQDFGDRFLGISGGSDLSGESAGDRSGRGLGIGRVPSRLLLSPPRPPTFVHVKSDRCGRLDVASLSLPAGVESTSVFWVPGPR